MGVDRRFVFAIGWAALAAWSPAIARAGGADTTGTGTESTGTGDDSTAALGLLPLLALRRRSRAEILDRMRLEGRLPADVLARLRDGDED